jgi:ABC-type multidrug transport system fused ATPase/permease subunit
MQMIKQVFSVIGTLSTKHRFKLYFFTFARAILGLLDLVGIFFVGVIASIATGVGFTKISPNGNFLTSKIELFSLQQLSFLTLMIFLVKTLLAVSATQAMGKSLISAEADLTEKIFNNYLRQNLSSASRISKQDMIYALGPSANSAIFGLLNAFATIISESFLLLAILTTFAIIDLKLTVSITLYFIVVGTLIQIFVGKKNQQAGTAYALFTVKASKTVDDGINAFREITALEKQDFFSAKFQRDRIIVSRAAFSIHFLSALPRYIIETALMIGTIALVLTNLNSPGGFATLGIFITGGLRIMASLLPLQNSLGNIRQLVGNSEKFLKINSQISGELKPENRTANSISVKLSEPVGITLKSLNFSYDLASPPIFTNLSLHIEPGSMVAIVGPSGGGKSTLADLMIGLFPPSSGEIVYTSESGSLLQLGNFRIGYVPQRPGIITGTLIDNIALGVSSTEIDFVQLENALKKSHLEGLVEALSLGLETDLGEQLDTLSGGQFQRIGLARALYSNPNILILDEATSALDVETESAISDSISSLRGVMTTVVIAHRLSTIQNADKILILENGEITGIGKFRDLAKTSEVFAKYVNLSEIKA